MTSGIIALLFLVDFSDGQNSQKTPAIETASRLIAQHRSRAALDALSTLDSAEACYFRGLAYRQLQDHSKARQSLLRAWTDGYHTDYVLYSLVQEDYALGDKAQGLEHFQRLLDAYPESPWVNLLLADAHFAKEENVAARDEYLKALSKKPDLLEANFRLGYIAFQNGERESAAGYFRKEIGVNPRYVDAHLFLAETLLQLDRKTESLAELRKSLALEPGSDLIYKRLATTLVDLNQLPEADHILTEAERRFPNEAAFPAQHARVLTMLKRSVEAQAAAARARRLTVAQRQREEIPGVQ